MFYFLASQCFNCCAALSPYIFQYFSFLYIFTFELKYPFQIEGHEMHYTCMTDKWILTQITAPVHLWSGFLFKVTSRKTQWMVMSQITPSCVNTKNQKAHKEKKLSDVSVISKSNTVSDMQDRKDFIWRLLKTFSFFLLLRESESRSHALWDSTVLCVKRNYFQLHVVISEKSLSFKCIYNSE